MCYDGDGFGQPVARGGESQRSGFECDSVSGGNSGLPDSQHGFTAFGIRDRCCSFPCLGGGVGRGRYDEPLFFDAHLVPRIPGGPFCPEAAAGGDDFRLSRQGTVGGKFEAVRRQYDGIVRPFPLATLRDDDGTGSRPVGTYREGRPAFAVGNIPACGRYRDTCFFLCRFQPVGLLAGVAHRKTERRSIRFDVYPFGYAGFIECERQDGRGDFERMGDESGFPVFASGGEQKHCRKAKKTYRTVCAHGMEKGYDLQFRHLSGRFRFPVTKRTVHPMDGCSGHRSIRLFCPVGCGRQRLAVDNPFPSGDGSVSPPVSAPRPEEPVIAVRRLRGGYPALPSVPPALPSAEASCPIRRPVPCRVVRARCIHPGWHC